MRQILGIILLLTFGANAFGKEYYKNFQKKEFDWLMKNFISEKGYLKYFKSSRTRITKSDKQIVELYQSIKKSYKASLKKYHEKTSDWSKISFVQVQKRPDFSNGLVKSLKIIIQDQDKQQYFIMPGLVQENKYGHIVFFADEIEMYYHESGSGLPHPPMYYENKQTSLRFKTGDFQSNVRRGLVEAPAPPLKAPRDNKIWEAVEQMPSFPGGEKEMLEWIKENLEYPAIAKQAGISGTCYINFIVNKDGSLVDFKILRDIGGGCGAAAIKMLRKMPRWIPGKTNDETVRVSFDLPVVFE